jgi:hypothetical protein
VEAVNDPLLQAAFLVAGLITTRISASEPYLGRVTTARDLSDVRLNPWWFPHASLYPPDNDGTGGPFTIARVIHSSRNVGFTGRIGGVAVFNRALSQGATAKLPESNLNSGTRFSVS